MLMCYVIFDISQLKCSQLLYNFMFECFNFMSMVKNYFLSTEIPRFSYYFPFNRLYSDCFKSKYLTSKLLFFLNT